MGGRDVKFTLGSESAETKLHSEFLNEFSYVKDEDGIMIGYGLDKDDFYRFYVGLNDEEVSSMRLIGKPNFTL